METNRVLSRIGARLLSDEELQQIAGGFKTRNFFGSVLGNGACNYDPVTCRVISGDCSDVPPPCLGQ
jgi:bacteriocin-like protein